MNTVVPFDVTMHSTNRSMKALPKSSKRLKAAESVHAISLAQQKPFLCSYGVSYISRRENDQQTSTVLSAFRLTARLLKYHKPHICNNKAYNEKSVPVRSYRPLGFIGIEINEKTKTPWLYVHPPFFAYASCIYMYTQPHSFTLPHITKLILSCSASHQIHRLM